MVQIPPEVVTGISPGIVSSLIAGFLIELGKTIIIIDKQRKYIIPPISYERLNDFWMAYKRQEIRRGDPVCIYGVFSDLGLAMPTLQPDEAIRAASNTLEELSRCFSDNSSQNLQEQILQFDAQIDVLRLWLGSCMRPLPFKGFRYCNLFDETDIIPVKGLPVFVNENVQIPSPPFYGEVRGYVADIPPYWKAILKVKSKKPVAIVVDSRKGGKIEEYRDLKTPLYLSYLINLKYGNGNECIVATRGDYSSEKNYKACRNFLKTVADVEIEKLNARLLFEYDQIKRLTQYEQILDQSQIMKF